MHIHETRPALNQDVGLDLPPVLHLASHDIDLVSHDVDLVSHDAAVKLVLQ